MSCMGHLFARSALNRTTTTTIDCPIFCDVQQRLNDPATVSIGDSHRASVHLQLFRFEGGHFNEPLPPIGRDAFLTVDDLPPFASALNHSVPLYIPTI